MILSRKKEIHPNQKTAASIIFNTYKHEQFGFSSRDEPIKIVGGYGEKREIGDTIAVFVAKEDGEIPFSSHSGSYVQIGDEVRGLLPSSEKIFVHKGQILPFGDWIYSLDSLPIEIQVREIRTIEKRPKNDHEYYTVN